MKTLLSICTSLSLAILIGCNVPAGNTGATNKNQTKLDTKPRKITIDTTLYEYNDLVYVPIYSDIYVDDTAPSSLLAATLSVRNTSFTDSLILFRVDYFNTDGKLVRPFINEKVVIQPMATKSYVLSKQDDTGGHGANFIVEIASKSEMVKPVIQSIMIGEHSNKGFAFSTDGYSIL